MSANSTPPPWKEVIDVWKSGQVGLPSVVRWSPYLGKENGGVRVQNSLEHSYSITLLCSMFVDMLREHVELDEPLLLTSLLVHDHSEGELGRDIIFLKKTEQDDLDEYLAFKKRFAQLGPLYARSERAFLLQFALACPSSFPEDAQNVMRELAKTKENECYAYDAIERWDYVLYALEQLIERGNQQVLSDVIEQQMAQLNYLADEALPAFGKTIWTPEIRKQLHGFVDKSGVVQ